MSASTSAGQGAKRKTIWQRLGWAATEASAVIFWVYTLVKLFVVDIDRLLISWAHPGYEWVVNLKFLFFMMLVSVSFLIAHRTTVILRLAYIAFFPIVVTVWKIPKFIWKQKSWIIAFSFINNVLSFFTSVKKNVLLITICLFASAMALLSSDQETLAVAASLLLAALCFHFIDRFISVFRTTPVFKLYKTAIEIIRDRIDTQFKLEDDLRVPMTELDAARLEKWRGQLYISVLQNRCYLFAAKKLRDYQNSGLGVVAEILGTVGLLCVTVVVFTFINLALYKISPSSFATTATPTFFNFLYYSFNGFVFSSINEITATAVLSQAVLMGEKVFALLLIAIFASLLISVKSQRASREVEELIDLLSRQGAARELIISRDFRMATVDEAIETLEKLQAGTAKLLLLLSS